MRRHIARIHRVTKVFEPFSIQYEYCPICKLLIACNELKMHTTKHHSNQDSESRSPAQPDEQLPQFSLEENESDPTGISVIRGIQRGLRYHFEADGLFSLTERCENCHRRIVFLEVGVGVKAFDIDRDNYILGTHACSSEAHSNSLRTVSGGISDSNRRRH